MAQHPVVYPEARFHGKGSVNDATIVLLRDLGRRQDDPWRRPGRSPRRALHRARRAPPWPNWAEPPADVFRATVRAAMDAAPDGWVIDGNYMSKRGDTVSAAADTIVCSTCRCG